MNILLNGGFAVAALNAAVAMSQDTHAFIIKPVNNFSVGDCVKRDTRLTKYKAGHAYPYWHKGFKK